MNIAIAGLIMVGVFCIVAYFRWMSVQKKWRNGEPGAQAAKRHRELLDECMRKD